MNIIYWIGLGIMGGLFASTFIDGEDQGTEANILLGVVGALIGGLVTIFLTGNDNLNTLDIYSLIFAVFGSAIVIMTGKIMVFK